MSGAFSRYPLPAGAKRQPSYNFFATGTSWKAFGFHAGIDLLPSVQGKYGEGIYPCRSGVVVAVGNIRGEAYGNQVLIRHRFLWDDHYIVRFSFYSHLQYITDAAKHSIGKSLSYKTKIGACGSSGSGAAEGHPHCHFSWMKRDIRQINRDNARTYFVDPAKHLESARKAWLAAA
jgi:murein DD-endopeptidase MepM/ murein hydrolase activator NlpD